MKRLFVLVLIVFSAVSGWSQRLFHADRTPSRSGKGIVTTDAEPRVNAWYVRQVKHAKASDVKKRIDEVLKGVSPTSCVVADDRTGHLFFVMPFRTYAMLKDLLDRLDMSKEREFMAYRSTWCDPTAVANQMRASAVSPLLVRRSTDHTNDVRSCALPECGIVLSYGPVTKREFVERIVMNAIKASRPRCEYELTHTVLRVDDVKTVDEALSQVMSQRGKITAIRSQTLLCGIDEPGRDAEEVLVDGSRFRYGLTVGTSGRFACQPNSGALRRMPFDPWSWQLVCSNETSAVCERSGTVGAGNSDLTIGAVMVGAKTALVFRMSVQSRPLQLPDDESFEEDRTDAQPFVLRRPGAPMYVVGKDFVSVGRSDGTCAISTSGGIRELCITNRYADKPVTRIGDFAFAGCNGLKKVIVPEGVTEIGMSAFLGCSGLQCVVLPTTVTNIGRFAFATTESMRVPDIVCATGDKERMRKLIKSVLLRDLPRSTASRPMRGGLLRRNGECKENTLCEVLECTPDAQREIEKALSRIREISEPESELSPVAKPEVKQTVPRQGLLGCGSLRARSFKRLRRS